MLQAFKVNNMCVKDVFLKNNNFYFKDFKGNTFMLDNINNIDSNFIYDDKNEICYMVHSKGNYITDFGIYDTDFNFLMGLSAILICFCFLIGLIIVGATR